MPLAIHCTKRISLKGGVLTYKSLITISLLALLSACGGNTYKAGAFLPGDGLPKTKVDIAAIQDAVPKNEPRSPTGNSPYTVFGKSYQPLGSANGYREVGLASWYGTKFHGRRTSSGETYDMYSMSAAHRTLPLPSYVKVTNLKNKRSVIVKVNDRGPFVDTSSRIMDLSYAAAAKLGIVATGTGRVEVQAIGIANEATSSTAQNARPLPQVRSVLEAGTYLQLGAYSQAANAQAMLRRLIQNGFSGFIHVAPDSEGVYKVKLGPYRDADAALQNKKIVDDRLAIEARVVFE